MIAGEPFVGRDAVLAAMAWVVYSSRTIDVVASTSDARTRRVRVRGHAERVWSTIKKKTAVDPDTGEVRFPTRKVVQQSTGLKAYEVNEAIQYLGKQAPPLLRLHHKVTGNHLTTAFLEALGEWR